MPRSTVTIARLLPTPDPAPPDVPLLRAFLASNGEAAFEELVRRHGPMVLATCRRVLSNAHDAEDAFQATFLVLARKAATIRGNLAGWLYGVAVRTARGVRVMRDRRRKHESIAANGRAVAAEVNGDHDLAAVIDEELAKLPDHYREPLVLCELRGLSRKQAAAELGIAEGTLSSRLAVGKKKLAVRLAGRGLAMPAALVPLLAPATLSAALVRTAAAVARGSAGPVASAAASAVVKGMLFEQLKAVALAGSILLTAVCGGLAMTGGSDPTAQAAVDPVAKLVDQLGAADFADREAAAKALREMGFKAEAALRGGLRSESPEVRDRSAKLLAEIRAVARTALVKQFDPATDAEPDHPIWKRFKSIAGNDAAARKLFAEIIDSPQLLKLLDDADREPGKAGDLYAAELERWYKFVQGQLNKLDSRTLRPEETPYPTAAAIMYLGTYPSSAGKSKEGWRWEGHLFIDAWGDVLKSPVGPAVKRIFAAWLPVRDDSSARERGLAIAAGHRVKEMLPYARKVLTDETDTPEQRAQAALLIGVVGSRADISLLRETAETKSASKPYQVFNIILKGQEQLNTLWNDYRFGGKNDSKAWDAAWKQADVRHGDRAISDCALASAVKLAAGRPEELGFLWPLTVKNEKTDDTWFHYLGAHGFESNDARTAAYAKAKVFLDKLPKEEPKTDPAVLKLIEQLGAAEFADREAAAKALDALGESALSALREAASRAESPEVRKRAADLARQIEQRTEARVNLKLAGHTAHVNGVAYFPDASKILTVGDMTYRIWDAKSGKELGRGEQGSEGYESGGPAAVSPDGKRIAVRYFVADPANHKFLFGLEGHTAPRSRITYSRDGSRILTASEDGTIRLWRPDFEKELRKIDAHMGKKLDVGAMVGNFGPGMKPPERFENRGARDAVFSFDGKRIVSGGDDGTVRIWDANTGAQLLRITLDKVIVTSVAFLADDKVVSGGSDGLVRVWDVDTGKEIKQFKGHTAWVSALAVTADDSRVVSTSHDGTARVWDAATGKELRCIREHTGEVFAVAIAPDGRTAVTGGADKTARVWSLPRPEQIKKEPDPAAKLVEQLGAAEFADREAAQKALREMGMKAEAALRAGLRSENPEVRDRCGKLLIEIRADVRDSLVRNFKPDGTDDPDHPIWKRFQTTAGNDAAARKHFAELIRDPRRLKLLDDAEREPDKVGPLYAREVMNLYRGVVSRKDDPWQDFVVIYLGTYPATAGELSDATKGEPRAEQELAEVVVRYLSLLNTVEKLGPNDRVSDETLAMTRKLKPMGPAAKRVLAAWYPHRRETEIESGLRAAVINRFEEVLPFARVAAADPKRSARTHCSALQVVAMFGKPADLPLFEEHFADKTVVATFEFDGPIPVGSKASNKVSVQLRDAAAGLALLLIGEDPAEHGFLMASGGRAKRTDPLDRARFSLEDFGFLDGDEKSRAAAHEKVKAFLENQPKKNELDPVAKLVEQLGAAEFADREAASKALREMGLMAEAALRAGLKSENPEVRDRAAKALAAIRRDQIQAAFVKVVGNDTAAQDLFGKIMSSPRGVDAIKTVLDNPAKADEVYRERTAELMRVAAGFGPVDADGKASVPTEPEVHAAPAVPLGDVAGWMFLGSLQSGKSAWREVTHEGWQNRLSSHVTFLPEDDYTSAKPIAAAYLDPQSAPLKKLTAAWLAKRRENDMLRAGLTLAIRYDIADALAAARNLLKEQNTADISPPSLAAAMVLVGLHGTKDDLPLLARHTADDRVFSTFLNLPPGTDLRFGAPPAKDGRDLFCHVRDAAAATMCKLAGKDPADFGFPTFPKTKHASGAPMSLSSSTAIGFKAKSDRDAAFEKAAEWLKSFEQKEEPKQDVPARGAKVWPHFVEVVGGGKDDRALFDKIVANAKNLELLEKAAAGGAELEKLYFARRDELYNASRVEVPGRPGVVRAVPVPAEDAAAWLLMGTFSGTKATAVNDVSLTFLRPNAVSRTTPFLDLLSAKNPLSAPTCKLIAAWLANRGDDTMAYADALPLVLRHEIPGALPTALRLLKDYAESKGRGARPFTLSQIRALSLLAIAKYGSKADAAAVDAFLKDENLAATMGRAHPSGAKEVTVQVRDAAAIAAIRIRGGDARALGLLEGKPDEPLDLAQIGFATQAERDAAHRKVQEWLAGQPKNEEPEPVAKLVEQLGTAEFADREAAQKALAAMGMKAMPAVRAGLASENPEIVKRCNELIPVLKRALWNAAKEGYAKDPNGFEHPIRAKLQEIVGDAEGARELFADLLADDRAFIAADEAVKNPKEADRLYRETLARLVSDSAKWQADPKNARSVFTSDKAAYAAFLFTGTFPGTGAEPSAKLATLLQSPPEMQAAWNASASTMLGDKNSDKAAVRKLFVAWMAQRSNPDAVSLGLSTLRIKGFADALLVARTVAADAKMPTPVRGEALLYLGIFGTVDDVPLAKGLFDDKTEFQKVNGQREVQVRDIATAVALRLHGRDPVDHGFFQGRGNDALMRFPLLGFPDETSRARVLKPAHEWLEKQVRKEEPAPGLLQDLADLDAMRRGEGTDFAAVEKRGEELLKKYPAADRGRIYSTLTVVYSNSGIEKTFARVEKYGRLALDHQKDPVARGMIFSQLASAAEVAVRAGDPLADDPFTVKRKRAAEIVLEGYRELLPLKLPDTAPELPGVMKIGSALAEAGPAEAAQLRAQHAAQMKAREEAAFARDMVLRRDTYATQLKYLYGREPKADDELSKLVEAALKDEKAATELMGRVAKAK